MPQDLIYLDHGATTALAPDLREGLLERLTTHFGNPSSGHPLGRRAKQLLESARHDLARVIGAQSKEIIFTAGGTESLGIALLGNAGQGTGRIAVSAVEHSAVLETAQWLARNRGWQVDVIPVDSWGRVTPETLQPHLHHNTRLVAIMLANNEVGTLNDIPTLAKSIQTHSPNARLIVDAVQALGKVPFKVGQLGADHIAMTAHKLHGPKGIGALWSKRSFTPVFKGGGQEGGLRGGTQAAPLAWAFAQAALAHGADAAQITVHRDRLFKLLHAGIPDLAINGAPIGPHRLGNNLHIRVPGLPSEPLLNALAARGVCASAGSACSTGKFSRVLTALGHSAKAGAFIRLTPGRFTTPAHIDAAAAHFLAAVAELREVY